LEKYRGAIEYLEDWNSGLFALTKKEYELLPQSVKTMLRIFQKYKQLSS